MLRSFCPQRRRNFLNNNAAAAISCVPAVAATTRSHALLLAAFIRQRKITQPCGSLACRWDVAFDNVQQQRQQQRLFCSFSEWETRRKHHSDIIHRRSIRQHRPFGSSSISEYKMNKQTRSIINSSMEQRTFDSAGSIPYRMNSSWEQNNDLVDVEKYESSSRLGMDMDMDINQKVAESKNRQSRKSLVPGLQIDPPPAVPFWMNPPEVLEDDAQKEESSRGLLSERNDNNQESNSPSAVLLAASSLLHWLKTDTSWREQTLKLLDIPKLSSGSSISSLHSYVESQQQYNQQHQFHRKRLSKREELRKRNQEHHDEILDDHDMFYYNLLDPFYRRLLHDVSFRQQLEPALIKMVNVGFGQAEFQQQYWARLYHWPLVQEELRQVQREIRSIRLQIEKQEKDVFMFQKELPEKNKDDLSSTKPAPKTQGNAKRLPSEIRSHINQGKRDNRLSEILSCGLKSNTARKKLLKLHGDLETAKHKEASLQKEMDGMNFLSESQFFEATQMMRSSEVKDFTCQVLANYIASVHSRLLRHYRALDKHAKLNEPHEWFASARAMAPRRIIMHAGPTNSGKTFNALQRLQAARTGMYYGPLRLLASEIHDNLSQKDLVCNLYTGQEKYEYPGATHGAATIEMAQNLRNYCDVAVIDEVQKIADAERGFAWTRALLGLNCPEIHVCGGMEAVDLVRRLADLCGDTFELHTYKRFSELTVEPHSLLLPRGRRGRPPISYTADNIQPGDCIVAFSRKDLFAIKREIEQETNYRCCLVYGSLPPETRREQAQLFNDPDSGYDILVASDAIGMGLNLNIRRIIFNTIYKVSDEGVTILTHSDIKQISGRAGRRNSPYPNGLVTCRVQDDLPYIRRCMEIDIEPIKRAALFPTVDHLEAFSCTLENSGISQKESNLHHALLCFSELASVEGEYFLGSNRSVMDIAKAVEDLDLTIRQKYMLCCCPLPSRDKRALDVLGRYARDIAEGKPLELDLRKSKLPNEVESFDDMNNLCSLVNELDVFLWLRERFSPEGEGLDDHKVAHEIKAEAVGRINKALRVANELELNHSYSESDSQVRNWFRMVHGSATVVGPNAFLLEHESNHPIRSTKA